MSSNKQFSNKKRKSASSRSKGRCYYCGNENPDTIDHIFPKSLGGTNRQDNLVLACKSCNCSKGQMTVEEYRAYSWRKANDIPTFSREQLSFLDRIGVNIFDGYDREKHIFWGEQCQ